MFFSNLKVWLVGRMPKAQELAAVYGTIVLILYGWTIYWYTWKLPSWLYFMTLGEMLGAYSYALVVNFLESLIVLFLPVFLCVILPARWFREKFVSRSVALVIPLFIALMYYLSVITSLQNLPPGLGRMSLLVLVGIAFVSFLFGRITFLRRILEEIASRAVIFLYIFMPLSALSILVVLVRNLLRL
jgi:hypothetical protein